MKTNFKYPFEFFALVALVISVPLLEAPKNIFWLVFLFTWLFNRIQSKELGGHWDIWDSAIALWIGSAYFIAAFAGLHNSEWGGANDILRYGTILWLVKRSSYHRSELLWLSITIVFSTLVALNYGLWNLFITHAKHDLELNSVGHVNHSAIYIAISYGALLSLVLAYWKKTGITLQIIGVMLIMLFAIAVFISVSRSAVGVMLMLTFLIGLAWLKRSKIPLLILLAGTTILAGGAYINQVAVVQKQESNTKAGIVLAYRDQIWRTALVAWQEYPMFGVGMHNFNQISMDKVQFWLKKAGKPYVASKYSGTSHAHSLYMNTLAERGLAGSAVLLSVLVLWLYWLIRYAPKSSDENLDWALWGGAFSAWFVTIGVGFVNTTLHHEHAILSMLLLGIWLASLRLKLAKSHAAS